MIVLEGPDGAGKTTLANQLSAALNIAVQHSGGPPKSREEIIERQRTLNDRLRRKELFIADRVPLISDSVYGPIIRGGTPFETLPHFGIELRMYLTAPIIYCRPPISRIADTVYKRKEPPKAYKSIDHILGVKDNLSGIVLSYDWVVGDFPHWNYDWTGSTDGPSFEELVQRLRLYVRLPELVM